MQPSGNTQQDTLKKQTQALVDMIEEDHRELIEMLKTFKKKQI